MREKVKMIDRFDVFSQINDELALDFNKTAVIQIDMHKRQIDPEWSAFPQPVGQKKVANAARFLKACRSYGLPIIHVMVYQRPIEQEKAIMPRREVIQKTGMVSTPYGLPKKSPYDPGAKEGYFTWDVMPELGPEEGDYIINTKRQLTSSYYSTDLEYLIKALEVDTFLCIGINTNNCVGTFAMDGFNRGLNPILISDCVGSTHGNDLHQFALQNIARTFGFVLTEQEAYQKIKESKSSKDKNVAAV
ncbi:cysteine hydrolase [Aquibacillus albus]|uniref:Nicotinamidase-related amidase n=1 Tax=Aquibacillus albus TaxID=1168171 RepID=A0ABS2N6D9_9BACI|nr:cysteine hydrolase [Aquibacillus albus]MBM7573700.1 nicotinamidase-related amidase [Aquibacillus albus]